MADPLMVVLARRGAVVQPILPGGAAVRTMGSMAAEMLAIQVSYQRAVRE